MLFLKLVTAKYDVFYGKAGAGGVFFAEDSGRVCIQLRSQSVREPGTWGTWGGRLEDGETPEQGLRREVHEESGYFGAMKLVPLYVFKATDFEYHNYLIVIPHEFKPKHSWETDDSVWCEVDNPPSPLHAGLKILYPHLRAAVQKLKM